MNGTRILYLSSQFPTRLNPQMGVFSVERVRALSRAGYQVSVVAPVLMTPPAHLLAKPAHLVRWLKQMDSLPDRVDIDGVKVHYSRWFCPPKKLFGWTMSAFLHAQIRHAALQAVRELQPHLLLSSWLPDGVAALKLAAPLNLPVLCIADGTDVNQWPEVYPAWGYARDMLNRQAAALIYVSEALHQRGIRHGLRPRREIVLHNSVDVQTFKPGRVDRDEDVFSILAVGRMVPVKGYPVLLEAFAQFAQQLGRPTRLTIVGDGELRPSLMAQAERLGILPSVYFAGVVEPAHMPSYYQAADLLCLPSYSEGLPCVAVEALACGKPVVASRVGGVPELIDDQCGLMVPPGDAAALCQALLRAAGRPWDARAIRQKVVNHFSWEQWTARLSTLINSVLTAMPSTSQSPQGVTE